MSHSCPASHDTVITHHTHSQDQHNDLTHSELQYTAVNCSHLLLDRDSTNTMKAMASSAALLLLWAFSAHGFAPLQSGGAALSQHQRLSHRSSLGPLSSEKNEYSRDVRLREEAESPFRKVRFFFYSALGGGATLSLVLSVARAAAALSGVNPDLLQESVVNGGVDLTGLVVIAFLYQRDLNAEASRLKRLTVGAALASLAIRASPSLADTLESTSTGETFTTTLAALRQGRGIDKRVVICAGSADKVSRILEDAVRLNDSLVANDLIVVPVILPQGIAPIMQGDLPESIALPVGKNWRAVIDDETEEAREQGVDVLADGISIILKKNGRVGQRTKGIFLGNMVGDVEQRREMGMDVKNI